jgi:hypothetical protein
MGQLVKIRMGTVGPSRWFRAEGFEEEGPVVRDGEELLEGK